MLERIAECESGDRHFDANGDVITGHINPNDTGRFQINTHYHGERAREMGLDLFDKQDNEAYARWLYEKRGVQPWSASEHCWK